MAQTLPPVEIIFRAAGLPGVKQAFSDFDSMLAKLERNEVTRANTGARARISAEERAQREIERAARAETAAKEKAAKAAQKAEEKAAREAVRVAALAERDKTRAAEREAQEKQRIEERLARHREQVRRNSLRYEQTLREQSFRDESRAIEREMRRRERFSRSVGGIVGGGVSAGLGTAGRLVGIAAGVMGGFSIASALETGIREESMAGTLVRGAENTGGLNRGDVLGQARAQAIRTGGNTADVLGGIDEFVKKTGDLKSAMGLLKEMNDLSTATGTAFEDMGRTGAEVFGKLRVAGREGETMDVMRAFAGMGRAGAIDIRDLGQYGGRLAAAALKHSGDVSQSMISYGAIAQMAKESGSATDAAEATMSAMHVSSDVSRDSKKVRETLDQYKINVWANKDKTQLIPVEEIVSQAVVKTKGNLQALHSIFGERSIRAVEGVQYAYNAAGGGDAGETAIRRAFDRYRNIKLSPEEVQKNVADAMTEPGRKAAAAMEQLHLAINSKLLPLMPELIRNVTEFIPVFSRMLGWLAENPVKGLGALMALSITKELTTAGIGIAAAKGIEKLVSVLIDLVKGKVPPPMPTPPAVPPPLLTGTPSAATVAGMGLGGFAAGVVAPVAAGVGAGALYASKLDADKARARAAEEALMAETGKSVEDQGGLAKARENLVKLQGMKQAGEGSETFSKALVTSPYAGAAVNLFSAKTAESEQYARDLPKLVEAIRAATEKLNQFGSAASDATASLGQVGTDRSDPNDPSRHPIRLGQ